MTSRRTRWILALGALYCGCGGDSSPVVSAITDASGSGGGTLADRLETDVETTDARGGTVDSALDALDGVASDAVEAGEVDRVANPNDGGMVLPPPQLTWKHEVQYRQFRGIWGSGPDDIYAVGDLGTIVHFTGGKWVNETAGTSAILYGVWGSGRGDVYIAVDSDVVLHSTGDGKWEHQAAPIGSTFIGIWGSGPDDVYLYYGYYLHRTAGQDWSTATVGRARVSDNILHMWGTSATDIWAAGSMGYVYHSRGEGTGWMSQAPAGSAATTGFVGVGGSGAADVYAITGLQLFHSWGDGKWTPQAIPTRLNVDGLVSIWALSPTAVYAGTNEGMLLRTGGDGTWVGEIVDPPGTSNTIYGIWGTSPTNLYLAANGGIYHGTL